MGRSKFYDWRRRRSQANAHNDAVPRESWLTDQETEAVIQFHQENPSEGYRRLSYMMLDADVAAVSPSSVYRILKRRGLLQRWNRSPSKKGDGFDQPTAPHEHWHTDVTYVNICGTFYYLCSLLDGFSRYIVHWELREQMTEQDVEITLQRGRENFPAAKPRIISDNGPQFIANDFKTFIRHCGMTHVRTSPNYPQSNGKIERWHGSLKRECIRRKTPLSLDDARRIVDGYVQHYNNTRLHSAIGYIAPHDKLQGRAEAILAARQAKLAAARTQRRAVHSEDRQNQYLTTGTQRAILPAAGDTEAGPAGERPARDIRPGGDGHPSGGVGATDSPSQFRSEDVLSFPHAFLNSDLPQASRSLTREGELSNSR